MDRFSEVEVKFRANHVDVDDYHQFMKHYPHERYTEASGTDTYYRVANKVVRYRKSEGGGILTYKERKSRDSILDRVEIDLPLAHEVQHKDVETFLSYLGAEPLVDIFKTSYIYSVYNKYQEYRAVLALYDVKDANGSQRFLEVEIDRSSVCDPEYGRHILEVWKRLVMDRFKLAEPLNASLFEIYSGEKQ